MKFDKPFNALVIVGGWNRHIFTLYWIKRYLLPKEEEELSVEMQNPLLQGFNAQFIPPRILSKEVRFMLQGNKLNFSPVKNEDKNLDRIQELALQLADYLPHTPVSGFGINFLFTEDHANKDLINLIRPSDSEEIEKFSTSLTREEYTRHLVLDGRTLNFTIELEGEEISFNLNFHFDIGDLVEFKAKFSENPMLELKQEAAGFITEIYGLELKGENE